MLSVNNPSNSKSLIIGMGNASRQDDGVGLFVIEQLRQKGLGGEAALVTAFGDGFSLLEMWKGRAVSILVDSVCSGSSPGTIHRMDVSKEQIPEETKSCSTHAFSVPEIIELARSLQSLPAQLIFYGVEGRQFSMGQGLSLEVEKAAHEVVERIIKELRGVNPCTKCR